MECILIERKNREWYYIIEKLDAPRNAYNWLDYAYAFGPFNSEAEIREILKENLFLEGLSVIYNDHYSLLSLSQRQPYEDLISQVI